MRTLRRATVLLFGFVLVVGLAGAGYPSRAYSAPEAGAAESAATDMEHLASVTITLADLGLDFGAITQWEASLYAGAEIGEETSGRFTEWVWVNDNDAVVFVLPDDVREDHEAPWDDEAYVRIRGAEADYPGFDLVSDPFTLEEADYAVHFDVDGVNEYMPGEMPADAHEGAEITVMLQDLGGEFGAPGLWEASLYAGAVAGEETDGRFTEWVEVDNGEVVFNLPEDVRDGDEAPWDDEAYVRIRRADDEGYPEFDLVGRPFMLAQGQDVLSMVVLSRMALEAEATVMVSLSDMGLDFGAIENWEASLYAGAEIGEETAGRFTEWVTVDNGWVAFVLPEDVREGDTAPWYVPTDTYVRIRSGDDEYPEFDLVSDPFTLVSSDHSIEMKLDGFNNYFWGGVMHLEGHQGAVVTVRLQDLGGEFGAPGPWEASLYAGAVAGEETSGRFTDWVWVNDDDEVVFLLPEDVREDDEAPWDDEAYVRIRGAEDDYPEFDLVGRPFILSDGAQVRSTILMQRATLELPFMGFLPLVMRQAPSPPPLD